MSDTATAAVPSFVTLPPVFECTGCGEERRDGALNRLGHAYCTGCYDVAIMLEGEPSYVLEDRRALYAHRAEHARGFAADGYRKAVRIADIELAARAAS